MHLSCEILIYFAHLDSFFFFCLLSFRTFVVRVQTRRDFYNKFNIYHQNPWSYKKYKITISLTKYIISIYSKECLSNIYRCEDIKFHSKKTHVKTQLKITYKYTHKNKDIEWTKMFNFKILGKLTKYMTV